MQVLIKKNKNMKFENLKEGLFVKYEIEQIFANNNIYGKVVFMNENMVRILTYDDFEQFEFNRNEIESMKIKEIYGADLRQYLEMRKEILIELLDEIKTSYDKNVVDINIDLSKLNTCINDLKS